MARPNVLVIDKQRDMRLYAMLTKLELDWSIRTTDSTIAALDLITSSQAVQGSWWHPDGIVLGSSIDASDCATFIKAFGLQSRSASTPIIRFFATPAPEPEMQKLTSVRHIMLPSTTDGWRSVLHGLDGLLRRASSTQSSGATRLDRLLGKIPA